MDALSAVLRSVSLTGAVFFDAEFHPPWCVRARFGLSEAQPRLPEEAQVALFHWLTEGSCKVRLVDTPEVLELVAGDMVLFPADDQHLLGSDLGRLPIESSSLMGAGATNAGVRALKVGEGDTPTRFVCGYVAFDRVLSRTLLQALPRMLRIDLAHSPTGGLIRELLRHGVRESGSQRPGSDSMLAKLSELLFVEALRCHVETLPAEHTGWLAGVRDRQIGRALALLHADPQRAWTVEDLAREVALSRSALADRFTALVGESPMQYLLQWRLTQAARALRAGQPVSRVARDWGYESDAAFSRAFKRELGVAPSTWRRRAPH